MGASHPYGLSLNPHVARNMMCRIVQVTGLLISNIAL